MVRLVGMLKIVAWTRRYEWRKLDEWVDESGSIVLLGDAARPAGVSRFSTAQFQ